MLSAKVAPRHKSSLQVVVAADMSMSSRGVVGSATAGAVVRLMGFLDLGCKDLPAATAGAPQAAFIAGPGLRTGGDVTAPWAAIVAVNAAIAARIEERIVRSLNRY